MLLYMFRTQLRNMKMDFNTEGAFCRVRQWIECKEYYFNIYLIDTDYLYDNAHYYGYLCHFLSKILFIYHKETGHCFAAPATIQQWNFISFLVNLNSILLLVCRVSCLSLRPTFFIIKNEAFQLKANEARNDFKGRALIKHFIACRHCCFG